MGYGPSMTTLLEVDSRKRVSLGQAGELADRYLMERGPDGVITLTPAVVMSPAEVRLLGRLDILEAVDDSRTFSAAGGESAGTPVRRRKAAE